MRQANVSAIIPVYNNGAYIASAVQSVLAQTQPPAEVIVVDDGSTDDTAAALAPFRDCIKYVYQPNRGEPSARNRGIREAKGDYIAFLDGDDLWFPNKLERQIQYFEQHSSCALVYADMSTFDESGTIDVSVKDRLRMTLPTGRIFRFLLMRPLFGSGTVVFRKNCLDTVGFFDESLLIGSDYEMWLRIARHFDVGAVDEPLLKYRYHAAMSTRGRGRELHNGVPWEVVVVTKILQLYPDSTSELSSSVLQRRISKPFASLALTRFRQGDHKEARALFRKAASHWPTNIGYWACYWATFLRPAQISAARKLYHQFSISRRTHQAEASEVTSS